MKRWILMSGAVVLVLVMAAVAIFVLWPQPIVPDKIQNQLTSTLILPQSKPYVVARRTVKYDAGLKLLSFTVRAFGKTIIVSEQPTPEQFTDVPQVYTKVLDGMNDYDDFDVNVGSVHLTTPPQLSGLQTAVMNTKGTLIFAKPSADLSGDQWRQFFTTFVVEQ